MRQLTLILFILFDKARITVGLTWNTEKLSYSSCQSQNQLLVWNFTEGGDERITELQWFFNETTLLCLYSTTIGFHVETLYHGRIELNERAGILLKNVSLYDAGKYSLYVKLAEEKKRNIQHIFLAVHEKVPYQCKPVVKNRTNNVLYCSTNCSERLQLSPEWVINGTQDPKGIGPYLRINAGINEQALCCLRCHDDDDQYNFCMPNPILSKGFTEDTYKGRPNETNNVKDTKCESTVIVMIIVGSIMMAAAVCVTITYLLRRKCNSRDVKPKQSNMAFIGTEDLLMEVDIVAGAAVDVKPKISDTAKECTEDLETVDIVDGTTDDLKPNKSDTANECTEDLEYVDIVVGTTDRSLKYTNSRQNIQIVNNVSMDGEFLKYIVDSERKLLKAVQEETRQLKRQLQHSKHSQKRELKQSDESFERKEVTFHHYNHYDTDESETSSEYEEASSEPFVHHDWSGSIQSSLT